MCSGPQHDWGDRTFWSWHVPELHPAACLLYRQALAWWGEAHAREESSSHDEAPLFLRITEEVHLEILWSVQQCDDESLVPLMGFGNEDHVSHSAEHLLTGFISSSPCTDCDVLSASAGVSFSRTTKNLRTLDFARRPGVARSLKSAKKGAWRAGVSQWCGSNALQL